MIRKLGLCVAFVICLLLCGCGNDGRTYEVKDPLSEDEIIEYVRRAILEETGDDTEVRILSKEDMFVTIASGIDSCVETDYPVKGGHTYHLEIRSKADRNIVGTGTYEDGCTVTYKDGKTEENAPGVYSDYKKQRGLYLIDSEYKEVLGQYFSEYYIYKDVGIDVRYDIFLQCTDYVTLSDVLRRLGSTANIYEDDVYSSFNVFIYKDAEVFQKKDFCSYLDEHENSVGHSSGAYLIEQYTGKNVTRIGESEKFDRNLFETNGASAAETNQEYVEYTQFDYLVFYFYNSSNSSYKSFHIYGVKDRTGTE